MYDDVGLRKKKGSNDQVSKAESESEHLSESHC